MSDIYQLPPGRDIASGLPPVDLPVTGTAPPGPLRITVGNTPVPVDPYAGALTEPSAPVQTGVDPYAGALTEPRPKGKDEEKPQREISAPAAAAMGVAEGASFGTAPAIAGTHAAGMSLLPQEVQDAVDKHGHAAVLGPLIAGLTRLGYEDLIKPALGLVSGGAGTEAYNKSREGYGAEQQAASEQHPIAYTAGQVGGALATPGLGVGAGGISAGIRAGAAGGGLYGTGQAISEGKDSGIGAVLSTIGSGGLNMPALYRAATSPAVTGAITGGFFGLGGAALTTAAQKIGSRIATLYRGGTNADAEALRTVVATLQQDFKANGSQWTPETAKAAHDAGIPLAWIDAGGEGTRDLARSAANLSSQGRQTLEKNLIEPRFHGQGERADPFIRSLTGGGSSAKDFEAIDHAARAANAPAYKAAYAAGDRPITSTELERLMGSETVADAARGAEKRWKDFQILDGYGAANPPVKVTPDGRFVSTGGRGIPTYPNIQFWDYTARNLAGMAQTARDAGNKTDALRYGGLEQKLKAELDNLVDEYGKARKGSAEFFGAEKALNLGKEYLMSRKTGKDAMLEQRAIGKLSPDERELFAHGFASDLADKLRSIPNNQSILNSVFVNNTPAKERIVQALGPQRAGQLEAYLRAESLVDQARKAMGNSTTARQQIQAKLAQGGGIGLAGGGVGGAVATYDAAMGQEFDPQKVIYSALFAGGLRFGAQRIDQKVAQRIAEMLASSDPDLISKATKLVSSRPYLMDALRHATGAGTRVAAHDIGPTRAIAGAGAVLDRILTPGESKSVNPYSNSQFVNQ